MKRRRGAGRGRVEEGFEGIGCCWLERRIYYEILLVVPLVICIGVKMATNILDFRLSSSPLCITYVYFFVAEQRLNSFSVKRGISDLNTQHLAKV